MKSLTTICFVVALVIAAPQLAVASITGVVDGTGAPPATLGPYAMTAFPDDARADYSLVTSVASPLGGTIDFSIPMDLRTAGSTWLTWSHGYTGDVYFTGDTGTSVTLTLPTDTLGFYFYGEPDAMQIFRMTATAQDGTQVSKLVDGAGGASYMAFWADGGDSIASITVDLLDPTAFGFAVGEFGIASSTSVVPVPGAILLGGIGVGLVGWLRRRRTL